MRQWQKLQFPETTSLSAAKHLRKETKELLEKPDDLEEWVDALHLVVQGLTKAAEKQLNMAFASAFPLDLPNLIFDATKIKLNHNIIERQWQKPDADGVVEHDRSFRNDPESWTPQDPERY